jgi:hypothetical protein
MSGAVSDLDYKLAIEENLLMQAKAAIQDPDYAEVTANYKCGKGIWDTSIVFLMHEEMVHMLEEDTCKPPLPPPPKNNQHRGGSNLVVGSVPWLAKSVTECRKRYIEIEKVEADKLNKRSSLYVFPDAVEGKTQIEAATAKAGQKMREDLEDRNKNMSSNSFASNSVARNSPPQL